MTGRRYAEGTTVTVDSSRGEISGILAKHDAGTVILNFVAQAKGKWMVEIQRGGTVHASASFEVS